MPFAPYQWRSGKSYLPPSDSVPVPLNPAPAPMYGYYAQPPTYGGFTYPIAYGPGQPVLAATPPPPATAPICAPCPAPPAAPAPEVKSKSSTSCKCKSDDKKGGGGAKCHCHSRYVRYTYSKTKEPASKEREPEKQVKEVKGTVTAGKKEVSGKVTVKKFVKHFPPPPPAPSTSAFTWKSASSSSSAAAAPSSSSSTSSAKASDPCSKKPSSDKASDKKKSLPPPAPPSSSAAPSTTTKSLSTYAPPSIRPGVNYMFPARKNGHTMLHIFNKAAPIWEEKFHGKAYDFKIFKVAVGFSVKDVVDRVMMRKKGEEEKHGGCKGWGITEVVEVGDGRFVKGTTVEYDSDKAGGSLESMGWNAKRGDALPPVWLVVHKIKKK